MTTSTWLLPGWAYGAITILGLAAVTALSRGFFLWSKRDLRLPDDTSGEHSTDTASAPVSLDLDELETWAIRQALQRTGGNITQAAKILGCVRDTLASKIKKKGIDPKLVET